MVWFYAFFIADVGDEAYKSGECMAKERRLLKLTAFFIALVIPFARIGFVGNEDEAGS